MASTVEQPFLNPNCASEILALFSQNNSMRLIKIVVNSLEKQLKQGLFLYNYSHRPQGLFYAN